MCSWRVISSCFTSDTRRVNLVTNLSSPPVLVGFVLLDLKFMRMFCRSLFVLLSFFFFWPFFCSSVLLFFCSSSIYVFWLPLWYLQTLQIIFHLISFYIKVLSNSILPHFNSVNTYFKRKGEINRVTSYTNFHIFAWSNSSQKVLPNTFNRDGFFWRWSGDIRGSGINSGVDSQATSWRWWCLIVVVTLYLKTYINLCQQHLSFARDGIFAEYKISFFQIVKELCRVFIPMFVFCPFFFFWSFKSNYSYLFNSIVYTLIQTYIFSKQPWKQLSKDLFNLPYMIHQ